MAALFQSAPLRPRDPVEILDLRHFSGAQLEPLLRDQATRWQLRHRWDYTRSVDLLLDYLESRVLPGFVAVDTPATVGRMPRVLGYAFCVYEAEKAVLGDIYAFNEGASQPSPISAKLLTHLLEMLQNSPGVQRIESQLLMFDAGSLSSSFTAHSFRSFPRLFMIADLTNPALQQALPSRPEFRLERWQPEHYTDAAALIHRCYQGHGDALINDQYQSVAGAQRFLHNIIRFPGCGVFDPESSLLLRDTRSNALQAVLLCSRVRSDVSHITQLCVSPSVRGQGLGHLLLQRAAQDLRSRGIGSVSLTVTEANAQARALYASVGFTTLHRFEAMTWDK